MAKLKPYQFVRTVVVFATDPNDADDKLQDHLTDMGGDLYEDWAYDEETSVDPTFIKNWSRWSQDAI